MLKHSFPYNLFEKNLVFKFWTYSLPFFNLAHWGFKKIPFTLYTYVLAKILQNGATFVQKLTPGFQNHIRNLDNFRQAVESLKTFKFDMLLLSKKFICPKNTFLQLKDYIHRLYLTLLSTTSVKIHQITYVIFETKSHFFWHNSFVFF